MARTREDRTVEFENTVCIKQTDKALLCTVENRRGDRVDVWFPITQVHDDSEVFDDGEHANGKLVVTEWIAIQKGLV